MLNKKGTINKNTQNLEGNMTLAEFALQFFGFFYIKSDISKDFR